MTAVASETQVWCVQHQRLVKLDGPSSVPRHVRDGTPCGSRFYKVTETRMTDINGAIRMLERERG